MKTTQRSADEIRERMRLTRERVRCEVSQALDDARDLTDWRTYLKRYPRASLGAAAFAGYFLVPRRTRAATADAKALEEVLRKHQPAVVIKAQDSSVSQKSLLGALVATAGAAVLRMGMTAAGQAAAREMARRLGVPDVARMENSPP